MQELKLEETQKQNPKPSAKVLYSGKDTLIYPPCKVEDIPHYTSYKINTTMKIDGKLDESVWIHAPRSGSFRDLVSGCR